MANLLASKSGKGDKGGALLHCKRENKKIKPKESVRSTCVFLV